MKSTKDQLTFFPHRPNEHNLPHVTLFPKDLPPNSTDESDPSSSSDHHERLHAVEMRRSSVGSFDEDGSRKRRVFGSCSGFVVESTSERGVRGDDEDHLVVGVEDREEGS